MEKSEIIMTPMISNKIDSSVIGGKTARPCDGCAIKRARWYCATDDVFLCQACDSSVHTANPLANTHQRVRLKTASNKSFDAVCLEIPIPSWNRGATKKLRTPRHGKHHSAHNIQNWFPLVPEISYDDASLHKNEDQLLLYRVPIYNPFIAELCSSPPNSNGVVASAAVANGIGSKAMIFGFCDDGDDDHLNEFLPSEMDLADFTVDVESLLGGGFENESFEIEELGLIEGKVDNNSLGSGGSRVKLEACSTDMDIDLTREPLEFNIYYDSHAGEKEKAVARLAEDGAMKREMLRLDYEAVINAWSGSQRSPWTTGTRPDLDNLSNFRGSSRTESEYYTYGETSGMGTTTANGDVGREAKVSRYREKRRTRLFSKKIRYEVRKLNAEKRPRMKGRFVKRTSFGVPGFPMLVK